MSGTGKLWRVIYNGEKYGMIPDHHDTNHQVISTGMSERDAANMCDKMNFAEVRKATGNFFTGLMHISAETAGHCVKTIKDGYDKGRK